MATAPECLSFTTRIFALVPPAIDVLHNGCWPAYGMEFLNERIVRLIEWRRLPAGGVFIGLGVLPAVIATGFTSQ